MKKVIISAVYLLAFLSAWMVKDLLAPFIDDTALRATAFFILAVFFIFASVSVRSIEGKEKEL